MAVCNQLQEHRSKLKESTAVMMNKENLEEGNYRKSFEGAKKTAERVFTSTASGVLRPPSSQPLEKRVKSISNIHKSRY